MLEEWLKPSDEGKGELIDLELFVIEGAVLGIKIKSKIKIRIKLGPT